MADTTDRWARLRDICERVRRGQHGHSDVGDLLDERDRLAAENAALRQRVAVGPTYFAVLTDYDSDTTVNDFATLDEAKDFMKANPHRSGSVISGHEIIDDTETPL